MVKRTVILMALFSLTVSANSLLAQQTVELEPLEVEENADERLLELEDYIATAASKFIYVDRDCNMPIDPDKAKNYAKLKAFSEGHHTLEGVSWEKVKRDAHLKYADLKKQAPEGELCEKYGEFLKDKYHMLKKL